MCDVGGAGWQSGHRNSGDTAEERAGFKAGDFVEETLGGGAIPPCRTTQPFVILYRKKKGHIYICSTHPRSYWTSGSTAIHYCFSFRLSLYTLAQNTT